VSRLGHFVLRHPRKIVGVWLVVLIASGLLALRLGERIQNGGYTPPGSQSQRALELGERYFPASSAPQVAVALRAGRRGAPLLAYARQVREGIRDMPGVEGVAEPLESSDGRTVLVAIALAGNEGAAQTYVPAIESGLGRMRFPLASARLIGEIATYDHVGVRSKQSLQRSALISFPVLLAILLVAFVSLSAALLPLSLAAVSLGVTFGLLYLLSFIVQLSVFVEDAVLVLGLGLSIDFSLFMVTRVREALARGSGDLDQAIIEALTTTGRAIMMSGLTIVVALGGLYVTGIGIFSSLATGSIGATLLAVAAGVTLVPALLSLLGRRLERFPLRVAATAARSGAFWHRLGDLVIRRRLVIALASTLLMLALALPLSTMHIRFSTVDILPSSDSLRQEYGHVAASFGAGVGVPVVVIARSSPRRLATVVSRQPGVVGVAPPETGAEGWARVAATLGVSPDSNSAVHLVGDMRAGLPRELGRSTVVAGSTALGLDLVARIDQRTPLVVLIVALAEMGLLAVVFAAPLIAIKAALTTLLSVAAALGAITLLFHGQDGITYFVPLFLFATVFGLSTDYEVFLLSRVREYHRAGSSNDDSVRQALISSGRSISLAGIAMSIVFFAFALSPLVPFQELGVGMGLAILLDVTVVRCLLVPATVALLGDWNWWRPRLPLGGRRTLTDQS
jgi:putative drug exporter of the RND superfamily